MCVVFCRRWGVLVSSEFSSAVAASSMEATVPTSTWPSRKTAQATCEEWVSWVPPRTYPALVMQAVSEKYVNVEQNFMRLMELNSVFKRHHLYLMCMDDASVRIFATLGIRCVPLDSLQFDSIHDLWKTRIRALSCLVTEGYDVIMSDADALWLRDPMDYFNLPEVRNSSVVASRGNHPRSISNRWGASMCLGFILFRATGPGMVTLQKYIETLVLQITDDQIATNKAVNRFGITWDEDSDMRFANSTGLGRGTIDNLFDDDDEPLVITLLPHSAFTRLCASNQISNETVVAHCHSIKRVGRRVSWMQEANLGLLDSDHP